MRLLCCVVAAVMMLAAGQFARADVVETFDISGTFVNGTTVLDIAAIDTTGTGIVSAHEPQPDRKILLASGAIEPTPEPTSVAMLGTSLLGLALLMRLRFRP